MIRKALLFLLASTAFAQTGPVIFVYYSPSGAPPTSNHPVLTPISLNGFALAVVNGVLTLTAPKGIQGIQGIQGVAGPPGPGLVDAPPPAPMVSYLSPVTLSVGANCTLSTPCNSLIAGVVYTFVTGCTITYDGLAPTTVRVYISDGLDGLPAGTIAVLGNDLTVSAGCSLMAGSQFPGVASVPLAMWGTLVAAAPPYVFNTVGQDLRTW